MLINLEAFRGGWLAHIQDRYDAIIVARWDSRRASPIYSFNDFSAWIASARVITRSNEEPVVRKPLRFRYKEFSVDEFNVYRTANCSPSLLKQNDIETLRDRFLARGNTAELWSAKDFIAAELFLKELPVSEAQPDLSIEHLWEQVIREPVIPFNHAERQTRLNHAYQTLREYLADFSD